MSLDTTQSYDSPQMHFEYEHVHKWLLETFQQQQSTNTNIAITNTPSDAYATSDLDNNISMFLEDCSKVEEKVREVQEEDVGLIRSMRCENNNSNNNNNVTRNSKKDRHSKINTARGPRDRRMRLSLEVARKFFDLQDLLGFDKPSKAVDWLLKNSSHAIRELMEGNSCEAVSSITSNTEELGRSINYSLSDPFAKKHNITSLEGEKRASCDENTGKRKNIRKKEEKKKTRLARTVERESRRRARERARERTSQKRRLCETMIMTICADHRE